MVIETERGDAANVAVAYLKKEEAGIELIRAIFGRNAISLRI
jgi:hypothetical protein